MTQRHNVYLPNPDDPLAKIILPKSGIVGTPIGEWGIAESNTEDRIVIDYEGNRFGAVNMVTFADRVYHAYGRHTEHYPTVARRLVKPDAVIEAGYFYPAFARVEVENAEQLVAIAKWLDLFANDRFDAEALHRELVCTHARTLA